MRGECRSEQQKRKIPAGGEECQKSGKSCWCERGDSPPKPRGDRSRSGCGSSSQGAKYPEMSSTRCTGLDANELINPLSVGTIAWFEVTTPSRAFNVETSG